MDLFEQLESSLARVGVQMFMGLLKVGRDGLDVELAGWRLAVLVGRRWETWVMEPSRWGRRRTRSRMASRWMAVG